MVHIAFFQIWIAVTRKSTLRGSNLLLATLYLRVMLLLLVRKFVIAMLGLPVSGI